MYVATYWPLQATFAARAGVDGMAGHTEIGWNMCGKKRADSDGRSDDGYDDDDDDEHADDDDE